MRFTIALVLGLLEANLLFAQVVSTDLPYITVEDSVTLTFDSNQGNGNLSAVNPVYMHTGLIKSSSDYDGDWHNQVSLWGEADPDVEMTNGGGGVHSKGINIEDFYNTGTWDGV
ncbi:MAG: hypothetical protein QF371_01495, partial [Flavobacteriales bacterium]|nr:hypothetical protein [Flavobacteriales bacterium]